MFRLAILVVVVGTAVSARADDVCSKGLDERVLKELATAYSCDAQGTRCYDGQNGRPFRENGDYFEGDKYFEFLAEGKTASIHVFATQRCATGLLDNVKFESTTVKVLDTVGRDATTKPVDNVKAKETADKVDKAKDDVDEAVDSANKAFDGLNEAIGKVQCPASSTVCAATKEQLTLAWKEIGTGKGTNEKLKTLIEKSPDLEPLAKSVLPYTEEQKRIADRIDKLRKDLKDLGTDYILPAEAGDFATPLQAQNALVVAKANAAALTNAAALAWRGSEIKGAMISVRSETLVVPTGADNFEYEVTVKNEVITKAADGSEQKKQLWPNARLTIRINHGRYYFDYGFMFTDVWDAQRVVDKNGKTDCPSACKPDVQAMFSATAWPYGRDRQAGFKLSKLIPGIQFGLNADLTKVTDALSIGLAIEPVDGFTVSAGGMFKTRVVDPAAAADSEGNRPTEHRWLFFVGITFSPSIYDSLKGLGDKSKEK